MSALLEVRDLSVTFAVEGAEVQAVRHVSFQVERGESMALVGESGSGKSVTALSIMQLLPYPLARHPSGSILFQGQELVGAPERTMQQVGEGILGQDFEPRPSPTVCSWCDYRLICPASEA